MTVLSVMIGSVNNILIYQAVRKNHLIYAAAKKLLSILEIEVVTGEKRSSQAYAESQDRE